MKYPIALSVALFLSVAAIPASHAQSGGMKGMDMKDVDMQKGMDMKGKKSDKPAQDKVHKGAGTVTKIDPATGTVTIAHGPIKTLNWSAMTMSFRVRDKALLNKVQPGAKVEFGLVQSGKDYLVSEIK